MCCGLIGVERYLTLMTKIIIGTDLFIIGFWAYMSILLLVGAYGIPNQDCYTSYVSSGVTEEMFVSIFAAIMFVLIPLFLMLIMKAQKGRAWW